jgi:hypothetical protein
MKTTKYTHTHTYVAFAAPMFDFVTKAISRGESVLVSVMYPIYTHTPLTLTL